ncbi:hypothetical protein AB2B41_07280 [Marimonas sp. MJW-29]|uniref:VPLPA-CTERM protein sorting domain-containing protein n=1 Tax=Sulfitobacter sediminis TaxID=3234186 RepID=A0ABV3RLH0_9RHOB
MDLLTIQLYGLTSGLTLDVPKVFESDPVAWQRIAPGNAVLIEGVNHLLNGLDTTEDFHTTGLVLHDDGSGTTHPIIAATPIPAALPLMLGGMALLGALAARRRRSV